MMTTYRTIIQLICLLAVTLSAQVHAEKRKFQIDIIVFAQDLATTEMLDAESSSLHWPNRLINPGQNATEEINSSSSTLFNAASILDRKPQYTILKHTSWVQTIASDQAGRPVRIQADEFNGYVQLKRGHNLHLKVGMEYPDQFTDTIFTLSEHRRILLNQKHYFDHPRLGVIANVTPQ